MYNRKSSEKEEKEEKDMSLKGQLKRLDKD
jgi:hypothetical protein